MATVLSSCAHKQIPNAEICIEIPFVDGAEGACVETLSRKKRLVSVEEWATVRPYMLMVHGKSWTEIKTNWLEGCRLAGPKCNAHVKSVDDVIQALDKILKEVFPVP